MHIRKLAVLDAPVELAELARLYEFPAGVTVRTNFVATIDGGATGSNGLSGSINNAADKLVYDLNRRLCQVVLVGARTADAEGYRPAGPGAPPIVAASNHGQLPSAWAQPEQGGGAILVVPESIAAAPLARAVEALGEEQVWRIGRDRVDLAELVARMAARGWARILCEGGPSLHAALLAEGLVGQVALSWVPSLVGGPGPRIVDGGALDVTLSRRHLLDIDGTLLGLWDIQR
ncbi:MAG: dihydrofolate reductase family protein [Tetrasphaera sp.]